MKNFRTVTIVGKRDNYETLYIQYFLRSIGIECVTVDEKEEVDQKSDIIFLFGKEKKAWEDINKDGRKNTFFMVDSNQNAEKMLTEMVSLFIEKNSKLNCMEDIRNIYQDNHLIEIFYEYTGVCLRNLGKDTFDNYMKKLYDVESEVEKLIGETEKFKEGVIFFKYYLIEKIKKFKWLWRESYTEYGKDFDTEYLLNHINEIYEYDEKYWQVEILKAELTEYDVRFSASPKFFYELAINESCLKQSKGENLYLYGKWKKMNAELAEMYILISKAVSKDLKNIKFYFVLMAENKKFEENLAALMLARDILKILEAEYKEKEDMSLQNLEILYKTYANSKDICESQFIEGYEKMQKEVFDYMLSLKDGKNDFASKMYPNDKTKFEIILAMIDRLDILAVIEARKKFFNEQ